MQLRGAALALTLICAGCATHPNTDVAQFAQNSGRNSFEVTHRRLGEGALVLPVVHDRQTEGPACGAHAIASVVNYWRGPNTLGGSELFRERPPESPMGYSMAELMTVARANGLLASAVRMSEADLIRELEAGRPVIIPVHLPSVYVQQRVLPGGDFPVLGFVRNSIIYRAARVSEAANAAMVDHYLVVAGYQNDTFVVVEPVMGYRTVRNVKLERWRAAFGDAAIVFSGPPGSGPVAATHPQ